MALESLLAGLAREADDEAAALVRAARDRRARAITEAESAVAARRAAGLVARERELAAAATVAVEGERRATLGRELEARASLLARIFARAADRLALRLERSPVRGLLVRLVAEALVDHADDRAVVRASPAVVDALAEALGGRGGARVVSDELVGTGARIVLEGGALEVDVTLESQLARRRPWLAAAIVRALAAEAP